MTGSGVLAAKEVNPRSGTLVMENNRVPSKLAIAGWEVIRVEEHQSICGSNTDVKLLHKVHYI